MCGQRGRTGLAALLTGHREHLVARGTYRASVVGEPPIGRNVVFCGIKIFRIAHGKIVERRRTERSPRSRARSQTCGSRTRWR